MDLIFWLVVTRSKKAMVLVNEQKNIVSNFSYKFVRGEKVGIIGKNGSGKSTFLKMINDPTLVDEGTIKIKKNIEFHILINQEFN